VEAHAPATTTALPATKEFVSPERLGGLVKRYVYAATAIFLVAGALGVVMRQSQADLLPVGENEFYAMMTAHGLGTFMAWGAFAIMGLGLWVLQSSEFGMRTLGYRLADITWWTTVIGTAGIVVTTLFMGFAGSWVFLYPLPFFSANEWGDLATGLFSLSVLLVGVGILTWCAAILHTVVGPANPAREGIGAKIAVGMGAGILWKGLLRSPDRQIPYAVIPLTVIALDMLIATLPLAVLLVIMIAESIDSSITVDPLLAKNMLWFFGHPVVYLLLFPAVAAYYLLIPRYAKRPLAAGNVIAIAWLIGVTANVLVWAHHIYVDYPQDSMQSVINVAMEPLTFSITLVSALSLYSLTVTTWRSDFEWNPASKFLVAGMFGWFTAGLSGVVNATIALDFNIHNTLWIVGHFHHMALLNIGLAIFGIIYAFLPELTGRRWYSNRLGDWHLWLTLIGGYGNSILWYIQGLNGGPRRYAVLPDSYEPLAIAGVPFTLLIAVGQLVFAWNLVRTLRGERRAHDEQPFLLDGRQVWLGSGTLCAAVLVPLLFVAVDRGPKSNPDLVVQPSQPQEEAKPADIPAGPGKQLFAQNCGSCHTLAHAGTTGTVGPNLDTLPALDAARVTRAIEVGGAGTGQMPADLVSGPEVEQVAEYVAAAAGAAPGP
jgi:cytochrome c oxidase subunit 1